MDLPRRRAALRRRAWVCDLLFGIGLAACRHEAAQSEPPLVDLLSIAPSTVELETRRYHFGADDRAPLLSGWSRRRDRDRLRGHSVVWAEAAEARFGLTVLRAEDKQVLVRLSAYPATEPQEIEVRLDERPIAKFRAEHDEREYRFVIRGELLRVGENVLTFHHSVVSRGRNPRESRRYAAAYASLLVGPACLSLRPDGEPKPPHVERGAGRRSFSVTGPAAISWTVDVPPGAGFATKLAVSQKSPGPAEVILEARTDGDWTRLAEQTLVKRRFVPARATRLSADASAFTGRRTELRVRVLPVECTTMLASVRVKRAAVTLQTAHRP